MKKSILIAIFAVLPLMAQEEAPSPAPAPQAPAMQGPQGSRAAHRGHREMSPEQKAKFMEKFDLNKDGQLDDREREAVKAEFAKRHQGKRPEGKRPEGMRPEGKPECGKHEGHRRHGEPGCGKPHGPRPEGRGRGCDKKPAAPVPAAPEEPAAA